MREMFVDPQNPTINELVFFMQVEFPKLSNDMKASNHNAAADEPNPYHIEDTIWTHTMMVCLRAENENSNKVVKISALLHDIGKPEARDIIPFAQKKPIHTESNEKRNTGMNDGKSSGMNTIEPASGLKTHFRGHEGLSFYRAIEIVNRLEEYGVLNVEEKERVLTVISLHGTLFDNIKNGEEVKPEKVIAKFNDIVTYRDLIAQVKNDSTGRFFTSPDGRKNQAYELGKSIYNDETFKKYFKARWISGNAPKITILVGVPACGKSTWREENWGDAIVISRDDVMMKYAHDNIDGSENMTYSDVWKYLEDNDLHKEVDKIEQTIFRQAVKDNDDIIIDRTNMSAKSRRKWLSNVPKTYEKEAIVFATVYEDVYSRNKKRAEDTGKNIGNWIIGNMMRQFIIPTYAEVDSVKFIF